MNQWTLAALTGVLVALYHTYVAPQPGIFFPSAAPELKLTYFNGPGRAELTRLVLSAGDVPFEDERLSSEAFAGLKPSLPLGQLPAMKVDGTTYTQSMALARYAAKLTGLYPQDPLECLRADMISESLIDLRSQVTDITLREKDEVKKAVKTAKLLDEWVPKTFALLEGYVQDDFFLGKLSYADVHLFDLVKNGLEAKFDTFSLVPYPKLAAVVENVASNANVAKYLAKQ